MAKFTQPTRKFFLTGALAGHPHVIKLPIRPAGHAVDFAIAEAENENYCGTFGVICKFSDHTEFHFSDDRAACLFKLAMSTI